MAVKQDIFRRLAGVASLESMLLGGLALAVGILYNWTVHKKVANSPDPGGLGVAVGAFSMLLWASIIFAGIFIAFV